jgi:hypothetical protein
MIVDCNTHVWASAEQLGVGAGEFLRRHGGRAGIAAAPADHALAAECADRSLVFAFRSVALGAEVPNDYVAEYVARNREKLIGVAAVDPAEAGASERAAALLDRREFRGLTISPAAQDIHPCDSRAMAIYELAQRRAVPVFFWQAAHFRAPGRMEYARPSLLDDVAAEFPNLVIVVSSLGQPWIEECLALMGKRPRVYADLSGVIGRAWQAYNALVLAHQYNVMDKVLLASGFPFGAPAEAIQAVYRLHEMVQGTNLPAVPREVLRGVIERDVLGVLGMSR